MPRSASVDLFNPGKESLGHGSGGMNNFSLVREIKFHTINADLSMSVCAG